MLMAKIRNPKSIAQPIGIYSHGIEIGGQVRWLHIAGQIGMKPDGTIPSTIEEQSEVAWKNVEGVLVSAGMTIENLVKVTYFLTSFDYVGAFGAVRARVLGAHRPASTGLVVSSLVKKELLVEVEGVAVASMANP